MSKAKPANEATPPASEKVKPAEIAPSAANEATPPASEKVKPAEIAPSADSEATPPASEKVKALFKKTYIGDYGIFYKKNWYTITRKLAESMKEDIEVIKE